MTGIFEWSATAASNASADSEINWAEGQAANTVNNSARAMMRRIRQFLDDQFGALTTGGTGNAYTVTTNTGITTLRDGYGFVVKADRNNTGACTLNPDGKGALPWRDEKGNEFQSGDIVAEGYYQVYYHSSDTTYRTRLQASRSNPHGGALLSYTNTSTVTLLPRQDGFLRIGGAAKSIPAAGVTGAATGKQTPLASTNSVISGSVATITLGATHSFVVGQKVLVLGTVDGVRSSAIPGLKTLTAVGGTTISYAAGIASLSSAADTSLTVYGVWFVYAYDSNADGVIDALEFSPTGHTTDSFGVEVKSGDTTRVLVGMVAIDSSGGTPVFADTTSKRFVRSYYNRQRQTLFGKRTVQMTTASLTPVEFAVSEMRSMFLTWADDLVVYDQIGEGSCTTSGALLTGYSVDGGVEPYSSSRLQGTSITSISAPMRAQMAEGLHAVGFIAFVTAGTGTIGAGTEDLTVARHFHVLEGAVF